MEVDQSRGKNFWRNRQHSDTYSTISDGSSFTLADDSLSDETTTLVEDVVTLVEDAVTLVQDTAGKQSLSSYDRPPVVLVQQRPVVNRVLSSSSPAAPSDEAPSPTPQPGYWPDRASSQSVVAASLDEAPSPSPHTSYDPTSQLYSEDFESFTTDRSVGGSARGHETVRTPQTLPDYTLTFESYDTSCDPSYNVTESLTDLTPSEIGQHQTYSELSKENRSEEHTLSDGTSCDKSTKQMFSGDKSEEHAFSESSTVWESESARASSRSGCVASHSESSTSSEDTWASGEEVSESTRHAEQDAVSAFIRAKLSRHHSVTPRTPSSSGVPSQPSSSGGTPRTPSVTPRPPSTPRSTLATKSPRVLTMSRKREESSPRVDTRDGGCRSFVEEKLRHLRRRESQPVVDRPPAKRVWDEVGARGLEEYGVCEGRLGEMRLANTMLRMRRAAKAKVHEPINCAPCRAALEVTSERDFVRRKFAIVSERCFSQKLRDPTFLRGDVIRRLGEHLAVMPRITDSVFDTVDRLMRPLIERKEMGRRVGDEVADAAADICGAPRDREEFWHYYLNERLPREQRDDKLSLGRPLSPSERDYEMPYYSGAGPDSGAIPDSSGAGRDSGAMPDSSGAGRDSGAIPDSSGAGRDSGATRAGGQYVSDWNPDMAVFLNADSTHPAERKSVSGDDWPVDVNMWPPQYGGHTFTSTGGDRGTLSGYEVPRRLKSIEDLESELCAERMDGGEDSSYEAMDSATSRSGTRNPSKTSEYLGSRSYEGRDNVGAARGHTFRATGCKYIVRGQ